MSRERMTGRILIVWEDTVGTVLTSDAAAGATVLNVEDVAPFNGATNDDGPGGWLQVGDQVVQYKAIDDDASTITISAPLATAVTVGSETGDVLVWNDLYGEPDTVQWAEVKPSGKRNQADTIEAVVADSVDGLANGDRGGPGEACTLVRDGDEWELTSVRGRPSRTRGVKFEADDFYVLTAADVTAGTVTFPLSHEPADEGMVAFWRGVPQEPTEYTVDYDAQTVTWPLDGFEKAGNRIWVHYAYRSGIAKAGPGDEFIDWGSAGWPYFPIDTADITDRAMANSSSWNVAAAPFGDKVGTPYAPTGPWPAPVTAWPINTSMWIQRHIAGNGPANIYVRVDNHADVYWNGVLVASTSARPAGPFSVPSELLQADNVLSVRADDDGFNPQDWTYIDVKVERPNG